jgi:hypothetical protein
MAGIPLELHDFMLQTLDFLSQLFHFASRCFEHFMFGVVLTHIGKLAASIE